jgi:hypothetical protein
VTVNIYEARWRNAVREAKRINTFMAQGCIAIYDGEIFDKPFVITEEMIHAPFSDTGSQIWYDRSLEMNDGVYDTVAATRARFREIKLYREVKMRRR